MAKLIRSSLTLLGMGVAAATLSGCVLRAMFGHVTIDEVGEGFNVHTNFLFSSSAALCAGNEADYFECLYGTDEESLLTTLYLLSEFGIVGLLIDPVIMQVPADVTEVTAMYDDGSGPQPLIITQTPTFNVTTSISVTAEAGQQFVILELPSLVTENLPTGDPSLAPEFDYEVSFTRLVPSGQPIEPMTIKVMLTGKVVLNGNPFYIPLLPCTNDFASVPELEIPISFGPVDLEPTIEDLMESGNVGVCEDQAYVFPFMPPAQHQLFMPIVTH